ncbi:MAG: hydrogenase 4 subunit F [Chloroflexi bacterium]|nr:hydrogenase 4 subunit F [Chloroflexota bacterium]
MSFVFLLFPGLLAALLAYLVRPYRALVGWGNAALSLVALGAALALAAETVGGATPVFGPADLLRADSLSALFMVCVAFVGSLALFFSPGLGRAAPDPGRGPASDPGRGPAPDPVGGLDDEQLRRYHLFINLFIFAMLLTVSANNVGIMWIAVEATTIFSAMVIPLTLTKASVEASWKYILICSVGIALAFIGTILGYFDFVTLSGHAENALNWPVLLTAAPRLNPDVLRLAFVFILIGYGTKAGIAPMHTWLPDAHSEAPSPLSAMMSGVLLAVALYSIMRWKVVVDAALGPIFTNQLLLALGLLSLAIAAFSLVAQHNYKRMLAYSSIEHTGLMCIGLGLGPLGVFAALLHLVSHTAAKSMLFILSGEVLHRYHSTELERVSGLLKAMPRTGALFAGGMLAIIGLPPFGLSISEFALFRAGFAAGQWWLMGAVLILLTVAFIALIRHLNHMLYGAVPVGVTVGEGADGRFALLAVNIVALVVLGLTLPAPLATLLNQIVRMIAP